jgi:hypothetical protein
LIYCEKEIFNTGKYFCNIQTFFNVLLKKKVQKKYLYFLHSLVIDMS